MAPEVLDAIVTEFMGAIREHLEEAAGLALAAEACASRGGLDKAVEIANDIDDLTHDASKLLNAIALLARRYLIRPPGSEADDD